MIVVLDKLLAMGDALPQPVFRLVMAVARLEDKEFLERAPVTLKKDLAKLVGVEVRRLHILINTAVEMNLLKTDDQGGIWVSDFLIEGAQKSAHVAQESALSEVSIAQESAHDSAGKCASIAQESAHDSALSCAHTIYNPTPKITPIPLEPASAGCEKDQVSNSAKENQKAKEGEPEFALKGEEPKKRKSKFDPLNVTLPVALDTPEFRAAWEKWIRHAYEIKKIPTPQSVEELLKQLAEWGASKAIANITSSIANNWRAIYDSGAPSNFNGRPKRAGVEAFGITKKQLTKEENDERNARLLS